MFKQMFHISPLFSAKLTLNTGTSLCLYDLESLSYGVLCSSFFAIAAAAVVKFSRQFTRLFAPISRTHSGASRASRRFSAHKILDSAALPARQDGSKLQNKLQFSQ
jgi:hypothetical protein